MYEPRNFTITDDHLKLLRRMHVGWQDCEYGAPEIDPKRPYGNSAVEDDICEILGWPLESVVDGDPAYSDDQKRKAGKIHRQMADVLQILVLHGGVARGEYEKAESYDALSWRSGTTTRNA